MQSCIQLIIVNIIKYIKNLIYYILVYFLYCVIIHKIIMSYLFILITLCICNYLQSNQLSMHVGFPFVFINKTFGYLLNCIFI